MQGKQLRIVIPTERFWPEYTGWIKQTLKLAQSLGSHYHFVSVSRPPAKKDKNPNEVPESVQICRRGPSIKQEGLLPKLAYIFSAFVFIVTRFRRFDVLYIPYVFFPGFVFILLGTLLRLPVVIRVSGQEVAPNRSIPAQLRFWSLQFVDAVVVLNKNDEKRVNELGVPHSRIYYIPNGVDVERFSPGRSNSTSSIRGSNSPHSGEKNEVVLRRGKLIIGFAGIICERKGVKEMISAFKDISDYVSSTTLLLAGPIEGVEEVDNSFVKEVINEVEKYDGDIELIGEVENMPNFYRSIDIFVLPSYREGMPNVLLEAMATGLPCVATNIPGACELVESGEDGILVSPKNSKELASALQRMVDKKERKRMGRKARKKITKKFSADKMASKYENVFMKYQ